MEGTPTMRQGSVGFNISLDKLILKEGAIEGEEREGPKTHGAHAWARAPALLSLLAQKSKSPSGSRLIRYM